MSGFYTIRRARADIFDAGIIADHRVRMFVDMGTLPSHAVATLREQSVRWIEPLLANGEYLGWFVAYDREILAGAGVQLRSIGPSSECPHGSRWAHIANVYTLPANRRQGLARRLLREILDWCRTESIGKVTLTASEQGRALYEQLGFKATEDMQWSGRYENAKAISCKAVFPRL